MLCFRQHCRLLRRNSQFLCSEHPQGHLCYYDFLLNVICFTSTEVNKTIGNLTTDFAPGNFYLIFFCFQRCSILLSRNRYSCENSGNFNRLDRLFFWLDGFALKMTNGLCWLTGWSEKTHRSLACGLLT